MQQQLALLSSMPYGDTTLVRNLQSDKKVQEQRLKPTSAQAQRASLAVSAQFRVSPRPTSKIKPKPLPSLVAGKVSSQRLFGCFIALLSEPAV